MLQGAVRAEVEPSPALRLVDDRSDPPTRWSANLQALIRYTADSGHCRPPYRQLVDGRDLYAWAAKQRSRRSRLTDAQRLQLEVIPGWSWNCRQAAWEEAFDALLAFVDREGHCRVPRSHVEKGVGIGRWVSAQRQRLPTMDPKRRVMLESLPGWTVESRTEQWWDNYAALARFADLNGHSRIPYAAVFEGRRLGMWVARQRRNHRTARLPRSRIEVLEALPDWCWNPTATHGSTRSM